jgi:hypothetical protein
MSPRTFKRIAALLGWNDIFRSKGNKPQRPVAYQLACFLMRFGKDASNALEPALKLSIGAGTVHFYCRRVTRALREVGLECVAWPNDERKAEIKRAMQEISHIPGCIGAGDGTHIELTQKPRVEGDEFFSYKQIISVSVVSSN